jgi:putative iron-regulated protein
MSNLANAFGVTAGVDIPFFSVIMRIVIKYCDQSFAEGDHMVKISMSTIVGFLLFWTWSPVVSAKNSLSYEAILKTYADIATQNYSDALKDAEALRQSLGDFAKAPNSDSLEKAKKAWLLSRDSYGQTEIFRLSGGPIDAEEGWVHEAYGGLEGQINPWPLDENMIDYTIDAKGNRTKGNIIDTLGLFNPGGESSKPVDVKKITVDALAVLNENGGEANVATGYHAIEFLLWGQDQDYAGTTADNVTPGPLVAGQRPIADFTKDPLASRRLDYLQVAAEKLVIDLKIIAEAWHKDVSTDCDKIPRGCYRAALLGQLRGKDAGKNIDSKSGVADILKGMGMFGKSELANERIAVAVLTPSEEDEHSCFSDNTHRDIAANFQGFINVLKGTYGKTINGPNMYDRLGKNDRKDFDDLIDGIEIKIKNIDYLAQTKWHFDYQILPGNNDKEIIQLKNDLRRLGDGMVNLAKAMGVAISTGDVTDPDETKI